MPRYHFQQRTGESIVDDDEEGENFPDLEGARRYALFAAREILAESIMWPKRLPPESIAVMDAAGRDVAIVFIVEVLPANIKAQLR